jgi:hypothetical protein
MSGEKRVSGSSLDSFEEAAKNAFEEFEGDPNREGMAAARVVTLWLEKGGFVGRIQYHVELEAYPQPGEAPAAYSNP